MTDSARIPASIGSLAIALALAGCADDSQTEGGLNEKPAFIRGAILATKYDATTDDLLTAGLGKSGLAGAAAGFADPANPTAAPGKNIMALELPNAKRQTIRLSEVLGSVVYHDAKSLLTMGLGKDSGGLPVVVDLAKMSHCLVSGTTGSGKSVGINAMILSLLDKADARDGRLMLIDPKMREMSVYEGIPHLLCPVVTDMKQAANGLNWCVAEMEKRYKLLSKMGVRNLAGFNAKMDEAKARGETTWQPIQPHSRAARTAGAVATHRGGD